MAARIDPLINERICVHTMRASRDGAKEEEDFEDF